MNLNYPLTGLDPRLNRRYQLLVQQHMTPAYSLSNAIKDLGSTQKQSFTTTQAVWRFLNNDSITFKQLNEPILTMAHKEIANTTHQYALVAHDWSRLQFGGHTQKKERLKMTHASDIGYELKSSLLINAENGLPIAPLVLTLTDNAGSYSTLTHGNAKLPSHLEAMTTDIHKIEAMNFDKKLVHIIDREADSIAHMRELSAKSSYWLIRAKEGNRVEHNGVSQKVGEVADTLSFTIHGQVDYKGKKADIALSETQIVITRASRPAQLDPMTGKRKLAQAGVALEARLVVVQLFNNANHPLCRWTLLTNVSEEIDKAEIAQWYYWRWNIESFFKLLKGAGHDVESWLQRSAEALLRRLLVACMSCVLAWRIQRAEGEENARIRQFVCRLSGRQQKRGKRESAPAILAGLSILLNAIMLLSEYSPEELVDIAQKALAIPKDV